MLLKEINKINRTKFKQFNLMSTLIIDYNKNYKISIHLT